MTLQCPACGSHAVRIVDSNGAEYPETRLETYECECGHTFNITLTA